MSRLEVEIDRLAFEIGQLVRGCLIPKDTRIALYHALDSLKIEVVKHNTDRQGAIRANGLARRYMLDVEYRRMVDRAESL